MHFSCRVLQTSVHQSQSMVRQQAQAEKLTLVVAENSTGYFGVYLIKPGRPKPYQAKVRRGGNQVSLGYFATAEEGQQGLLKEIVH